MCRGRGEVRYGCPVILHSGRMGGRKAPHGDFGLRARPEGELELGLQPAVWPWEGEQTPRALVNEMVLGRWLAAFLAHCGSYGELLLMVMTAQLQV